MALGFYFDAGKCIGCRTCEIACKDKWDLEVGVAFRIVRSFEYGNYPEATIFHYSSSCNHCERPLCVANCPQGAMYIADDGTVLHDEAMCIGCGTCVASCPYGVPKLLGESGKAGKCNACSERRAEGLAPACVESCHMRCLDFGEESELAAKYGSGYVHDAQFLPSSDETGPRTMILMDRSAESANLFEKFF